MKYVLSFLLLATLTAGQAQSLTEINFSTRIDDWNGNLSGQLDAITSSADGSLVFAASHPGGIFRSNDGGNTFTHLKNYPANGTLCIRYIGRSTPVLIAAAQDAWLETDRRSMLWYSTDLGNTWTKSRMPIIPLSYSPPAGAVSAAYDIAYSSSGDIIYAATDYGLLQSTDGGASFSYRESASSMPAAYRRNTVINSVTCGAAGKVYMAGPSGFYFSADGGVNWTRANLPVNPSPSYINAKNAISVVPSTNTVMLITSKFWTADSPSAGEYLYFTNDNGTTWANIINAPAGDGGCGGRPSVKCKRKTRPVGTDSCIVYVSNRCQLFRKAFKINAGGVIDFSNTAAWVQQQHYHDDVHELIFQNEPMGTDSPLYLTTDGGLHKYRGGNDFPLASGPQNGLNALLIYDLAGQTIHSSSADLYYLYYGTQDNMLGFWIQSPPPYTGYPKIFWEGRGLETGKYGGNITYTAGSPYNIFTAGLKYRDPRAFNNCPGGFWWPLYIKDQCYVQLGTPPGSSPGTVGLYLTRTSGRKWWLIWSKSGEEARMPKVFRVGDNTAEIFMPVLDADNKRKFTKIIADLTYFPFFGDDLIPPLAYSFMPSFNNFGKLGSQQWEIPVFGVNPANTEQIIAPDMESNTIKQSTDGGNNWTEISGLTNRVLADGQFKFRTEYDGSFVTSVGFSPSGQQVVMGTAMNGVFWSGNRGINWSQLEGSTALRNVYEPCFKPLPAGSTDLQEVFLPTHGRGIWKMTFPRQQFYFNPGGFPYWRYILRQPGAIGPVNGSSQLITFNAKTASTASLVFFHPDSVRAVTNTPNGIYVQLAANSTLYSEANGFIPSSVLNVPGFVYTKAGSKSVQSPNTGNNNEKISGVLIQDNKILALVTAKDPPPFFTTTKERSVLLAGKNPAYDEKKLNQFKDRFFVTTRETAQGTRYELTACNTDNRNGLAVYIGNTPIASIQTGKPGGCATTVLPLKGLSPGTYELEIKQKGSEQALRKLSIVVRAADNQKGEGGK